MPTSGNPQSRRGRIWSPWIIGAVALGWLVLLGIVVRDVATIVQLWLLSAVLIILVALWRKRAAADQRSETPGPPANSDAEPAALVAKHQARLADNAVMTDAEVADMLRVDRETVIKAVHAGQIPGNQIGEHVRIRAGSLVAWLDGSYRPPPQRRRRATQGPD